MKLIMQKRIIVFLFLLILFTACAPSPTSPVVTAEPVSSPLPTSVPTVIATDVPKQQELIFVEFFAIT